jgi:hypothetical protein
MYLESVLWGDVKVAFPSNAPSPSGKDVDLMMFVDSDHAGEKRRTRRRSRTGFIIYRTLATITWYSKKQATIITSVFGAEFVAVKPGMETLQGTEYLLQTPNEGRPSIRAIIHRVWGQHVCRP